MLFSLFSLEDIRTSETAQPGQKGTLSLVSNRCWGGKQGGRGLGFTPVSVCLSPCFKLCLQWLPLILPCGFCPRFLLSLYPLLLCFRSGLTPVKAHVIAEQKKGTGKEGMRSSQGVSVPHDHCHVILDSPPHPQWSKRCCFIILMAMILVDLILTPYLRISPTAKKQYGAKEFGGP